MTEEYNVWIPVESKMPDEGTELWITIKTTYKDGRIEYSTWEEIGFESFKDWENSGSDYTDEVIAWMYKQPEPEPYIPPNDMKVDGGLMGPDKIN